jgi:hypothetical protein
VQGQSPVHMLPHMSHVQHGCSHHVAMRKQFHQERGCLCSLQSNTIVMRGRRGRGGGACHGREDGVQSKDIAFADRYYRTVTVNSHCNNVVTRLVLYPCSLTLLPFVYTWHRGHT